jgi:hypothetical protein
MKVTKTNLHSYRNEQWFQFYTEFNRLTGIYTNLGLDEQLALFRSLYDKADEALEIIRKSDKTELISDVDLKRDHTFRGFSGSVKALANHFDQGKQEAVRQLQIVLKHYGVVNSLPHDEETAAIHNLLQDLKTTYSPQIALLGLGEWVEELEKDNNAFQVLVADRNTEEATRCSLRMIEVRKETDALYRQIIERLEALIVINGEATYTPFVNELNNLIKHNNNTLASRQGRGVAKKDEPKKEE